MAAGSVRGLLSERKRLLQNVPSASPLGPFRFPQELEMPTSVVASPRRCLGQASVPRSLSLKADGWTSLISLVLLFVATSSAHWFWSQSDVGWCWVVAQGEFVDRIIQLCTRQTYFAESAEPARSQPEVRAAATNTQILSAVVAGRLEPRRCPASSVTGAGL